MLIVDNLSYSISIGFIYLKRNNKQQRIVSFFVRPIAKISINSFQRSEICKKNMNQKSSIYETFFFFILDLLELSNSHQDII